MRMMKLAALVAVFGLLLACSTAPQRPQVQQPLQGAAVPDSIGAFAAGTLAPFGSFEWKLAPSYTQLATVRHNAARALRKKALSFEQALAVMNATDRARKALDDAVVADARKDHVGAEKLAIDGADAIGEAQAILRGEL